MIIMKEKATYKGFILWLVFFVASLILAVLPEDRDLAARLCFLIALFDLVILMLIIYLTERIYWLTEISFQQAQAAGRQKRKRLAYEQLMRFLYLLAIYLLWAFAGHLGHFYIWTDMIVVILGLCIVAFWTTHVKL